QAEDGIRDYKVTGVQTCALPISVRLRPRGLQFRSRAPRYPAVRNARYDRLPLRKTIATVLVAALFAGLCGASPRMAHAQTYCPRSEERRVGKGGRSRLSREH